MEIVVNEWLLEYLRPDARDCERNLAMRFINGWVSKCDRIVISPSNPFTQKFLNYFQQSNFDLPSYERFKTLHFLFRDPGKTILVYEHEIEKLPPELEAKVPPDDKYLIELAYSKPDRVILTSDAKLKEQLRDEIDLKIYLVEEFLANYFP